MPAHDVDDLFTVGLPLTGGQYMPQDRLRSVVMDVCAESKFTRAEFVVGFQSPASEATGHFLNVRETVPAVHAQCVQFQKLAGIVLVGRCAIDPVAPLVL